MNKYLAIIAHGELFVISMSEKYMHGELLSEVLWEVGGVISNKQWKYSKILSWGVVKNIIDERYL